ncbi:MAG: DUF1707 and DUF2154 domain-containing protein [Solirubrobacterales bacterium]|nr:DUF1707 and DUF2154 domain-containing protein [Solirubrobacterales bacterium]
MVPGGRFLPSEPQRRGDTRASDRDRDDTLKQLSDAASDGRITLQEYSGRADRALSARMVSELANLTADLQRDFSLPAEGPERLTAIAGNESRKGRWRVPPQLAARSLLGDCHIELQNAVLTSHVTTIDAHALLGAITIFVPDGVEVRLSGIAILGAKSATVKTTALPNAPIIDVRATAILGNVTVRSARPADRLRAALKGGPAADLRAPR